MRDGSSGVGRPQARVRRLPQWLSLQHCLPGVHAGGTRGGVREERVRARGRWASAAAASWLGRAERTGVRH